MVEGSLMVSKIDYLPAKTSLIKPQNQLAREVEKQCKTYFKNPQFLFNLPLKPQGTDHQNKVWNRVSDIPTGKTSTYGPYPLVTPCHRVVSAQGLGGFMKEDAPGFYRQIKIWLLKHEGVI
jgi:methylated-DNA-[protein]-cysteine S-methyltransferase